MMKLIKSIINRIKKPVVIEEIIIEKPKECEHDFEVVEYGDIWRVHPKVSPVEYTKEDSLAESYLGITYITRFDGSITKIRSSKRSCNRVCLKCGECDAGIKRFELAYKEQEKVKRNAIRDMRRREAWAKQLWADGCKYE